MAVDVTLKRTTRGFLAANVADAELLSSIGIGDTVRAKISRPRNLKHHKKWFALLHVVYPHQDTWPTFKHFRLAVQRAMGFFDMINGQPYDRSISFAKMDQAEFEQFYSNGIKVICERIVPAIDAEDLTAEVEEILKGKSAA